MLFSDIGLLGGPCRIFINLSDGRRIPVRFQEAAAGCRKLPCAASLLQMCCRCAASALQMRCQYCMHASGGLTYRAGSHGECRMRGSPLTNSTHSKMVVTNNHQPPTTTWPLSWALCSGFHPGKSPGTTPKCARNPFILLPSVASSDPLLSLTLFLIMNPASLRRYFLCMGFDVHGSRLRARSR